MSGFLIAANWKMNGRREDGLSLAKKLAGYLEKHRQEEVECVICPPFTLLGEVGKICDGVAAMGGQDCHASASGAFTGNISADMLEDMGCSYVIVGHSERREQHGETDEMIRSKAMAAYRAGLTPIICIGETEAQQEAGQTIEVIRRQVQDAVPEGVEGRLVIAYEPVWAIGTGKTASLNDIEMVHGAIAALAMEKKSVAPERISVLYGGSVKAANASEILAVPDVGGVLVGGASLIAEEFCAILDAANELV